MPRIDRSVSTWTAVFFTVVAAGCGNSTTTVSGTVSYQGKPLTGGSVTVVSADGAVRSESIGSDGRFTLVNFPTGGVKIGVTGPRKSNKTAPDRGEMAPPAAAPTLAAAGPPIPDKFADPQSSGLTGEVKAGQPFDIDVK